MLIFSDLHGAYHTFLRLLAKCPQDDVKARNIVLLGDLIDRGPNSREMVEWAMSEGVTTLMGNHEDLCLAYHDITPNCSKYYDEGIWLFNGGFDTIRSFKGGQLPDDPAEWVLPDSVLKWMAQLPIHYTPPQHPELFLSHTGHGLSADRGDRFTALWDRERSFKNDGKFRVFGHTPAKTAIIKSNYAMIDTGAAYSSRGYGTLSAMVWPTKEIITQVYDETPLTTTV